MWLLGQSSGRSVTIRSTCLHFHTIVRTLMERPGRCLTATRRAAISQQQQPITGTGDPCRGVEDRAPSIPRFPIPVVGALSKDLAAQLSTEVQLFDFDLRNWHEQLTTVRPSS